MAGATYWIGKDGNIYYGSGMEGAPVQNLGKQWAEGDTSGAQFIAKDDGLYDVYTDSGKPSRTYSATRIDDPAAAREVSTPTAPSGGAAPKVLNQAAVDNTLKAVESLDTEFDVGRENIDDSYDSLLSKYNKETARNKADYDEQGVTNNQNLLKNKQNALMAAAMGRRGLRGTLSAIGALSGDGGKLADRAVTTSANQDIGEAVDTSVGNAQNLDKALDRYTDEDKDRRAEAQTARENQETALEGTIAAKKQDFYQKLAEIFGEADRTAEAGSWLNKAGDLNETIARKSRVAATPFTTRAAAFTPGDLESYLAGAGDMTVDVSGGGMGDRGLPSSILAGPQRRRRDREEELVAA